MGKSVRLGMVGVLGQCAFLAPAQDVTYPWNPNADSVSTITVSDVLATLGVFGSNHVPESISVNGIPLEDALAHLQTTLDSVLALLSTPPPPPMQDACGGENSITYHNSTYAVVSIAESCWFAEHLRTDKYRNGNPISYLYEDALWSSTTSGAYCALHHNFDSLGVLGALYNGHAVYDPRGLCPSGWHASSVEDWVKLGQNLGHPLDWGVLYSHLTGVLAADSTDAAPSGGLDSYDFNLRAAGTRSSTGQFQNRLGEYYASSGQTYNGRIWAGPSPLEYARRLTPEYWNHYQSSAPIIWPFVSFPSLTIDSHIGTSLNEGLSVRCVKD